MIYSMTGFGNAEGIVADKKVSISLKSLNSKFNDIYIKVPNAFKDHELIYRKLLAHKLGRGKIEMALSYLDESEESEVIINEKAYLNYFNQLKNIHHQIDQPLENIVATICRIPGVLISNTKKIDESSWKDLENIITKAANELINFRKTEGEQLYIDLKTQIDTIVSLLKQVEKYEDERVAIVRERLEKSIEEAGQKELIDQDRFEQELIFFIEKYDISEEKVRLKTHCEHFIKSMDANAGQGKKLGFIAQEIGREINTLGSKANHAEMQKIVVEMKDSLEKIKEQILNVW